MTKTQSMEILYRTSNSVADCSNRLFSSWSSWVTVVPYFMMHGPEIMLLDLSNRDKVAIIQEHDVLSWDAAEFEFVNVGRRAETWDVITRSKVSPFFNMTFVYE